MLYPRVRQHVLQALADKFEPEFEQQYRHARCAGCERRLWWKMYHCWLESGVWRKEIHLCRRCWRRYAT